MEFCTSLVFFLACLSAILAQNVEYAEILVNGTIAITATDANYICATMDWWPPEKCNYKQCPWGSSSVLNLDISHPLLAKAIQAFDRLRIRVGGSLQDWVLYDVGTLQSPCHSFTQMSDGLFGFSMGCLHKNRWDELNSFFVKTRALVTFGLNALHGRHRLGGKDWEGEWDSSNAHDFMEYTISKGYQIDSWEFGNELSGKGIGARVDAEQYAKDLIHLRAVIDNLYNDFRPKPLLVAPGGFYDEEWFAKLLQVSGSETVNGITHHMYNLGAGVDPHLVRKILDPHYLSKSSDTFSSLEHTIEINGPWASAWVGESGGAYNGGGQHVSDTFVNSFWYLDQLAMAAKFSTKVYCRQTFTGGYYGLLNTTTFVPNPDYYSALLWHRLMGESVLGVDSSSVTPYMRSYAHCSKERAGITLLLINLSNQTVFNISVRSSENINLRIPVRKNSSSFVHVLKKAVSWIGTKSSDERLSREEYHLTSKDGDVQSKTMLLNGNPLELTDDDSIPSLAPVLVDVNFPISVDPLSIKFILLPNFDAPACK